MAYNVKFLEGLQSTFDNIVNKDNYTFYLTERNLYLGNKKLTSAADVAAALESIKTNAGDISTIETNIGDLNDLSTTNKTIVPALNELKAAIGTGGTAAVVTMTQDDNGNYVFKQGETNIGTVTIPKDMVVSSGQVVVNPDGEVAGTYLELTLANATSDKVYINVGTLVDIYTAAQGASQVQLAINSATREISAVLVAGSVTDVELADKAVVTAKIADGNVTLAKLATDVQASLTKANTAVQSVQSGTANGTIKVDGTDVAVTGLGGAAYQNVNYYRTESAAQTIDAKVEALEEAIGAGGSVSGQIEGAIADLDATVSQTASEENGHVNITVVEADGKLATVSASIPSETYDAYGAASAAEANAKSDSAQKVATALEEAKEYADQAETDAITTAAEDAADKASKAQAAAISAAAEDATTKANTAEANAKSYADGLAKNYDVAGSASAAEDNAKEYVDTALTWGTF